MTQPAEHPAPGKFRNGGASQDERRPAALLPTHLALDGRTLPELLAYVASFSEQLAFYTDPGTPEPGRWALAQHRTLLLLAVVAAQATGQQVEELAAQLQPLSDPAASPAQQAQAHHQLIKLLTSELTQINNWSIYHSNSNRQPAFAAALTRAVQVLAPGLRRVVHYEALLHAGPESAAQPLRLRPLLARFGAGRLLNYPSETQQAEEAQTYADQFRQGLLTHAQFIDALLELFWQAQKVKTMLATVARQMLDDDLKNHADHHPEIGLLVAFLELYAHAQRELNYIPHRHLDYYYTQVLHTKARPSVADQVYLTFALAEGVARYVLPAGTRLDGGKDAAGQRVLFETASDTELGNWQVRALATLFVAGLPVAGASSPAGCSAVSGIYASALVDPAIGLGPGAPAGETWPLFGEDPSRHYIAAPLLAAVTMGFAVAMPVLDLREGQRVLTLSLRASPQSFADFQQQLQDQPPEQHLLFHAFGAQVTGPKGWLALTTLDVQLHKAAHTITWTLELDRGQPAVVPYAPAVHGGRLTTAQPVLRLLLSTQAAAYGYSYFACLEPLSLRMQVSVQHLHQLQLSNQLGSLDGHAPFFPFGAQALPGDYLLVGTPELLGKNLTSITLALTWQNLPPAGLAAHYAGYGVPFSEEDFQVNVSYLANYHWQPAPARRPAQRLFQVGAAGTAAGGHTLLQLAQPGYLTPAAGGAAGLVRIELTAPAAGFGAQLYPAALADTARYNAHHKGRPRPLPQSPFVPMLNQLTLSYEAEETLYPSQGPQVEVAASFFHLHPFGSDEATEAGRVRLLPALPSEGTLLVGLSPEAAGRPISLAFDLTLPADKADAALASPQWEYLLADEWLPLPASKALPEMLAGFANSCQLSATLPAGPGLTSHHQMPDGLCWLRATVPPGQAAAFGRVKALYQQLVRAVRVSEDAALPAPYLQPLPAGSLARLLKPQGGIAGVAQPRPSFGGRVAEILPAHYTRVSERLRHRGRALTPWDYERLVLERFPAVYGAKCLTADQLRQLAAPRVPGQVLLVVLPQPDLVPGSVRPVFGAAQLAAMQQYLQALAPPAVRLLVRNPVYEQVQVRGTVRFGAPAAGRVVPHEQQLQQDVSAFLSPWHQARPEQGGFHRHLTVGAVLAFINQLPYVVGATGLSVVKTGVLDGLHRFYDSATDPQPVEMGALVPWAVLVPAAWHSFNFTVGTTPLPPVLAKPTGIGSMRIEEDLVVKCDF